MPLEGKDPMDSKFIDLNFINLNDKEIYNKLPLLSCYLMRTFRPAGFFSVFAKSKCSCMGQRVCVCDFAKRCPVIFRLFKSVKPKKNKGLAVLLGVSREPRPKPIRGGGGGAGWLTFFVSKLGGYGGEVLSL